MPSPVAGPTTAVQYAYGSAVAAADLAQKVPSPVTPQYYGPAISPTTVGEK